MAIAITRYDISHSSARGPRESTTATIVKFLSGSNLSTIVLVVAQNAMFTMWGRHFIAYHRLRLVAWNKLNGTILYTTSPQLVFKYASYANLRGILNFKLAKVQTHFCMKISTETAEKLSGTLQFLEFSGSHKEETVSVPEDFKDPDAPEVDVLRYLYNLEFKALDTDIEVDSFFVKRIRDVRSFQSEFMRFEIHQLVSQHLNIVGLFMGH
ncbi:hypothetical protein L596_010372 [Steinernema carpocapsae]|uniref:Uncharacterized protein n=1 Tax=Steinernema carpocapsae TaxID=34508 RepID=A0A4U5PID0_STECR|nr:hypothetical protein L596_010372 [Steinernema carpocapsae]